jgi:hypothetical protein
MSRAPRLQVINQFKPKPVFDSLPALSGYAEEKAILHDAVEGSRALQEAISAAVARFASSNRMTPEDASAILLGAAKGRDAARIHPHSADRTGHRPGEVLARPIGEIIKPIVARVMEGSRG